MSYCFCLDSGPNRVRNHFFRKNGKGGFCDITLSSAAQWSGVAAARAGSF
jgi:hypothetical protein